MFNISFILVRCVYAYASCDHVYEKKYETVLSAVMGAIVVAGVV
jgi:hypothetical protein